MDDVSGRITQVVFDCHDPPSLAAFWGAALGVDVTLHDPDWATVGDQFTAVAIAFQRVPKEKQVKNRLHLDIDVRDLTLIFQPAVLRRPDDGGPPDADAAAHVKRSETDAGRVPSVLRA